MDTRTESQPAESIREQLRRAEANLKAATAHFRSLRRAAFAGRYDPDAFDQAVLACRAAEAALLAAQHAMAAEAAEVKEPEAAAQPPAAPDTPQGAPAGEPDPLARLRFARWLVQTGRLSEQIAA
ncbi:MAG TPA: hypothetical protein VH257_01085 [Chloroflexota bacterium]|jgi:uncharacterized protein (DUF4415 family)|nr:hypothetical protein [Chloroflexota bacterium]